MNDTPTQTQPPRWRRWIGRTGRFILALLLIEFLDELVFGAREAAWPLIRDDLGLDYRQVGILLGAPAIVSSVVEPFLGILGDVWKRRTLIVGGGLVFALALALTAGSQGFWLLLLSFVLFYPASGAFVSLSQATLMDLEPARHEKNMARWTLSGSLGVVLGPLLLSGMAWLGWTWRGLFGLLAAVSFAVVLALRPVLRQRLPEAAGSGELRQDLRAGFGEAFRAMGRREVLRWLILLQFSDLMLDVLLGYLALYMVDVAGATAWQAGLAVAVWSGVGLLGDLLLLPLLERVAGLRYLRVSAVLELILFPAMLLAPGFPLKLALLGLLGFFNSGWYSILMAQLYSAMPGKSGTVMTVNNLFGMAGGLLALALGVAAQRVGLPAAMWLLLAGPIALTVGLPRAAERAPAS